MLASTTLPPSSDRRSRSHFVNADNKQTVPKIVRLYRDMGVRTAGIVDIDVLNDRVEFEKALQTLGVEDAQLASLLESQREIAQAVKELPADERLNAVKSKLAEVCASVDKVFCETFTTIENAQRTKDSLLRQLESRFREMAEMTKAWKLIKNSGRSALSPAAQEAFDLVWAACSANGFFINPTGNWSRCSRSTAFNTLRTKRVDHSSSTACSKP